MGDRVSYDIDGRWETQEGTIVGFLCVNGSPCAVIRTVYDTYITLTLDSIRHIG